MQISEDLFLLVVLLAQIILSMAGAFLVLYLFKWANGKQLFFEGTLFFIAILISFALTIVFFVVVETHGNKPAAILMLLRIFLLLLVCTPIGAGVLRLIKSMRTYETTQSEPNVWLISLATNTFLCFLMVGSLFIFALISDAYFPQPDFKLE